MSIVLDGTTGITTPGLTNTGTETLVNLTTTGNTILGDASTDTLNVGNGNLVTDASGNLGVGVTPSAWGGNFRAVQIGRGTALWSGTATDATFLSQNAYYDGTNFRYLQTAYASYYSSQLGQHLWYNAPSGTAGNAITFTQAMTLDASGNLGVGIISPVGRLNVKSTYVSDATTQQRFEDNTGSALNFGGTGGGVKWINVADVATPSTGYALAFQTGGTERARFNSTGALVFNGGTTTADGIGITFPATQSASSNANTLDDYEEGTWTPAVGGSATYNTQTGSYTKVGRLVYVRFNLNILAIGSGSTTIVSGLPFTPSATRMAGSMAYWAGLSNNVLYLGTFVDNSGFNFISQTASGKDVTDGAAILGSGTVIHAAAVYFV